MRLPWSLAMISTRPFLYTPTHESGEPRGGRGGGRAGQRAGLGACVWGWGARGAGCAGRGRRPADYRGGPGWGAATHRWCPGRCR
jgi:hypothetical protein